MNQQPHILAIAAHPDDEVLGCGATLARHARQGAEVSIAILGEGITGRFSRREQVDPEELAQLASRCRQAADQLGARNLFKFELPDNRLDTVPLLEIVHTIETLIEKTSPEIIYTHHAGDLNIDHVRVHRAVITATRPMKDTPVRDIYAFEVPSSTEWALNQFQPFVPQVFVDISETLEAKIMAMQLYESEARTFPHPRSPDALRVRARTWGSTVGLDAAEAFQLIRSIR